jgi:hypothetical protein
VTRLSLIFLNGRAHLPLALLNPILGPGVAIVIVVVGLPAFVLAYWTGRPPGCVPAGQGTGTLAHPRF